AGRASSGASASQPRSTPSSPSTRPSPDAGQVHGGCAHGRARAPEDEVVKDEPRTADNVVQSRGAEPRLPPGQIQTDKWAGLHYGNVPSAAVSRWDLPCWGEGGNSPRWTYTEFLALPRVQVRSDIHCVTRWSRFDNLWEGVSIRLVLERARPRPNARHVIVHAEQGYTTNLPLDELDQDDVLLASKHDGR